MEEPWGKSRGLAVPYPLRHHLVDTAAGADVLWDLHVAAGLRTRLSTRLGMSDGAVRLFFREVAAVHDLGKSTPCFQGDEPGMGHAEAGFLTLPTLLAGEALPDELTAATAYRIGEAVGGHHGVFPEVPRTLRHIEEPVRRLSELGGHSWHHTRVWLLEQIHAALGGPAPRPATFSYPEAVVLTGLVIVADWLASDLTFVRAQQAHAPDDPVERFHYTTRQLAARVGEVGLRRPQPAGAARAVDIWGFAPNPLQASIEQEFCPRRSGLVTVTAATGDGKTEAALLAAHSFAEATGTGGVYVALPTQATADQMRQRLAQWADRVGIDTPVALAHAMSLFNRDYTADVEAGAWLNQARKPLLAGVAAGTIDQALSAALATRYNQVRFAALAGKTLIVDEVHAVDAYMLTLLARLLSWCGHLHMPVVLLSATLPGHLQRQLEQAYVSGAGTTGQGEVALAYPGWRFVDVAGQRAGPSAASLAAMRAHRARTVALQHCPVRTRTARDRQLTRIARRAAAEGGNVVVICTTVGEAQRTYQTVQEAIRGCPIPVWLLHSRFPVWQRRATTTAILAALGKDGARPHASITVGSPVLEQSLDYDADVLVSDLAPMALLVQRVGRTHRHPRAGRPAWCGQPALTVLDPIGGAAAAIPPQWAGVYDEYELVATSQTLAEHPGPLDVPGGVDALVQQVHHRDLPPLEHGDAALHTRRAQDDMQHHALAGLVATPHPSRIDRLAQITHPEVDDAVLSTRPGLDSVRIIPRHTAPDGTQWLNAEHTVPFPPGRPDRHLEQLIEHSIPAPETWARPLAEAPHPWQRTAAVRNARILDAPRSGGLRLDAELGLLKES